jgi:hypothetical protein
MYFYCIVNFFYLIKRYMNYKQGFMPSVGANPPNLAASRLSTASDSLICAISDVGSEASILMMPGRCWQAAAGDQS